MFIHADFILYSIINEDRLRGLLLATNLQQPDSQKEKVSKLVQTERACRLPDRLSTLVSILTGKE